MGSFSIWHWLVVVILGGIAYALYRLVKPKQIKAGYSSVRTTYMKEPNETADDSVQESGNRILGLYKAVIGENNTSYYTKKFEQFDHQGPGFKMGWNWPAFLCGGVWALYRKMYGWFFVMLGITSIAYLMASVFMFVTKEITISSFIYGAPLLLFAMFADSIYHGKVRRRIAAAQIATRDEQKLVAHLRQKGGVHSWVIWVFGFLPIIGILAAIVIPAYDDSRQPASPQNQQPATGGYGPNDKPVGFGGYGPNDTLVDGASATSHPNTDRDEYISTDPNFGNDEYISTDPNFGLEPDATVVK